MPLTVPGLSPAARDELSSVLQRLVDGARSSLGPNFLGAYLQGSFALGAGDEYSDVDFLVVTRQEPDSGQEAQIRDLHDRLPQSEVVWAQHLEGSYVPTEELRCPTGRSWLYVDNGSRVMERSMHDNSRVMRWVLREHGITLTGPAPRTLVDEVTPDELREEARRTVDLWVNEFATGVFRLDNAWEQQHAVLSLCRFLYTIEAGVISGKVAAGEWAQQQLDPQWRPLISRAIADRPDPWGRVHRTTDPELVRRTEEFFGYVATLTGS